MIRNCQWNTFTVFWNYDTLFRTKMCMVKVIPPRLSQSLFYHFSWLKNHAFTVNKKSIAKKNRSTLGKDLVESLNLFESVARGILREKIDDNSHESDTNENDKRTRKWFNLSFSWGNRANSTSKSKVPSSNTAWKVSKYWVISGPYFLVFSPNTVVSIN